METNYHTNVNGRIGRVVGPARVILAEGGEPIDQDTVVEVEFPNGGRAQVLRRVTEANRVVLRASFDYRPGDREAA